jgi:hypothetical protein
MLNRVLSMCACRFQCVALFSLIKYNKRVLKRNNSLFQIFFKLRISIEVFSIIYFALCHNYVISLKKQL